MHFSNYNKISKVFNPNSLYNSTYFFDFLICLFLSNLSCDWYMVNRNIRDWEKQCMKFIFLQVFVHLFGHWNVTISTNFW